MSETPKAKLGELFRNNYGLPGQSSDDSHRFRSRLFATYRSYVNRNGDSDHAAELRKRTGATIPGGSSYPEMDKWFATAEMVDLLSLLTIVHESISEWGSARVSNWLADARRVFAEENILYVLDDKCGVHPKVDEEFQRSVRSAMVALDVPKYTAARAAFESAYHNLATTPPNFKDAVRDLFECSETIFKLAFGNKPLTVDNVKNLLRSAVDRKYAGTDPATIQTAARFVEGFERWVNSAHPYRHGHGTEIPANPPEELALAQFSTGAGFVRWLTTL